MSKSKDGSETEYLRGIVRKLRSELKNIKKQLSRSNKRAHQFEQLEDKIKELEMDEEHVVVVNNLCPKCNKEKLVEVDLGIRKLFKCENCGHRKTVKK